MKNWVNLLNLYGTKTEFWGLNADIPFYWYAEKIFSDFACQ